ncbi:MAG TPA: hypothetical protein VJ201_04850 [Candidatus Babeliales bacterium]|nr:hypothetical protein [Candidatus Babeliales bacterium]
MIGPVLPFRYAVDDNSLSLTCAQENLFSKARDTPITKINRVSEGLKEGFPKNLVDKPGLVKWHERAWKVIAEAFIHIVNEELVTCPCACPCRCPKLRVFSA